MSRTVHVDAAAGTVWTVLADFAAIAAWAPNVDHSCLLVEHASGVGATRRVQVGRTALVERVVTWLPGAALAYSIEGLPPIVRRVVNTWEIAPVDGGVDVSLTSDVDAGSRPAQRAAARAVARRLAAASDAMLTGIKRHVEESA